MYHYIPAVHNAVVSNKDTNYLSIVSSEELQSDSSVLRKSRVSMECHMSVLLAKILGDEDFILERRDILEPPMEMLELLTVLAELQGEH